MMAIFSYLLPRAHTSMTRSFGILLVLGMIAGFCLVLADALPGLLQQLGWQDASESAVVVSVAQLVRLLATLLVLVGFFSSSFAFAQRAGLIQLPELEIQLSLIREYLKDVFRRREK